MPEQDKDFVVVRLSEPVVLQGEKTRELRLEKPKLKHLAALDGLKLKVDKDGEISLGNLGSVALNVAVLLGGLTEREAGELPLADLGKVGEAFKGFFGGFLASGNSSSG